MRIESEVLHRDTTAGTDVLDLTREVEDFVGRTGIDNGSVLVFVPGSTGAVTTIEFESGAVADLKRAIEGIAPADAEYQHNLRWHDGNGYSHVRAALMGPSLVLPILRGEVVHGTWQQIVLCAFDSRRRRRRIMVQVTGV